MERVANCLRAKKDKIKLISLSYCFLCRFHCRAETQAHTLTHPHARIVEFPETDQVPRY